MNLLLWCWGQNLAHSDYLKKSFKLNSFFYVYSKQSRWRVKARLKVVIVVILIELRVFCCWHFLSIPTKSLINIPFLQKKFNILMQIVNLFNIWKKSLNNSSYLLLLVSIRYSSMIKTCNGGRLLKLPTSSD